MILNGTDLPLFIDATNGNIYLSSSIQKTSPRKIHFFVKLALLQTQLIEILINVERINDQNPIISVSKDILILNEQDGCKTVFNAQVHDGDFSAINQPYFLPYLTSQPINIANGSQNTGKTSNYIYMIYLQNH